MKRIFLALAALAVSAPGLAAERRYTVTDFDRVFVEGPFEVSVATGKAPSALVTGSRQAIERVSINVQGRTLRIRPNGSAWGGYPGDQTGGVSITLGTHGLRGATVTGSGSLMIDKAKALRFDVGLSGSGRLTLGAIEADNLILALLGSGRMSIGGHARSLRATIQGNGDLDAGALNVEDADIQADTAGRVVVAVARAAQVTATGPGEVAIAGAPACTIKATGSAVVRCGK